MKHDWRSRSVSFSASPSIRKAHSLFLFTLPLCIIGSLTSIGTVLAQQVTSDGTVSTTVITPDGKNFNINDGTTRGGNLFHSFKEFSVPNGGSANFSNAANIQNIISRVTGGSISTIDGLIKANGAANLFLLNPAGIIFGPNASLQIGGSFLGSTANSFLFDNGFEFSATNPQAPPLLTINVPIGLGFRNNPGAIQVFGTSTSYNPTLEVPAGKTLALVGGNVSLEGGVLQALGGRIELGGLTTAGVVDLKNGSLSFPLGVQRADVSLTQYSYINVGSLTENIRDDRYGFYYPVAVTPAGSIAINAKNINIEKSSLGASTTGDGRGRVNRKAGEITLNASGTISLINANASAEQGDGVIKIQGRSISLTDADLSTNDLGGSSGNIFLQADDSISLAKSFIFNNISFGQVAGQINLKAKSIDITDGSQINAFGYGDNSISGSILINASDSVNISDSSLNVLSGSTGKGGSVNVKAGSFLLNNGGQINVGATDGPSGSIVINADSVTISGVGSYEQSSGLFTDTDGSGQGGDIKIDTNTLRVLDKAVLNATTDGDGQGGNITINTRNLEVTGGAQILTTTFGGGNAGNIKLDVDNGITISGTDPTFFDRVDRVNRLNQASSFGGFILDTIGPASGIFANTTPDSTGQGGNINISAGSVSLTNDAIVTSSSTGQGNAGNIDITARSLSVTNGGKLSSSNAGNSTAGNITVTTAKDIQLDNRASIEANTSGGQGNITLNSRDLILRRNSNITTNATGTATGGNITINSPLIVAFPGENSDITANAFNGSGGKVTIRTQGLFGLTPLSRQELEQRLNTTDPTQLDPRNLPTNDITAISQNNPNLSGTVNIITPDVDPTRGLFELSETVIDPAQQIAQNVCTKGFGSTFTITGRGGLPTDPKKILSSDNVRVDLVKPVASTVSSTSTAEKQPSQKPPVKEIIPARGWIFNEKGEVLLVGYDPTKTGVQRQQPAPTNTCAALR